MRQLFTLLLAAMLLPLISFCQNPPEFHTYKQGNYDGDAFTTNNFTSIAVGKGNIIWAGTQYGGLYMYSDTADIWRKSDQLTNVFIDDIKADPDSGIWIAQSGIRTMGGNTTNIAGGVNYFRVASDLSNVFYSVEGTTTGANLVSRNVRSLYLDQSYKEATGTLPRPWVASGTYITSGKTKKVD